MKYKPCIVSIPVLYRCRFVSGILSFQLMTQPLVEVGLYVSPRTG